MVTVTLHSVVHLQSTFVQLCKLGAGKIGNTHPASTCSKSTMETADQCLKSIQS